MPIDVARLLLTERPDVPPEPMFDAWRLRVLTAAQFQDLGGDSTALSNDQLCYLACFGLLAPTAHNTVPQRFQLSPEGALTVWLDRRFVLPQSDAAGRQAVISCGCVIANVEAAAAEYGWQARVERFPIGSEQVLPERPGDPQRVALVKLTFRRNKRVCSSSRLHAMIERKVVRAEYDQSVKLSGALAAGMREIVSRYEGLTLHLLTDSPTLTTLGKFQELADTTVLNRDCFARELGSWLLSNDDRSLIGMRGREFGLCDEVALRFHRGLLGDGQLIPDEIAAFAKAAYLGMRGASAVAVVTAARDTVPMWIDAGRAYEELSLLLQQEGFVVSMQAAITEVMGPNLALRGRLRTVHRPVVVFRTGKPARAEDGQRPKASRPPLESLLLTDELCEGEDNVTLS
jgi:hypothetical protein